MIALSNAALPIIGHVASVPTYDRSKLTPGIVHIGLGNFHRAHQAWYLHRLLAQGLNTDWAIVGAGVRPYDARMRESLARQDYLTTLIEVESEGASIEIIGSMIDYVPVENHNAALIQRMAQPDIRIVALTVTEGGYYIDTARQELDASHPDIQHDVHHPNTPVTAFGAMVAALKIRRDKNMAPFTGMSCDNIRGNGDILRRTVVSLAHLIQPDLADWIESHCAFPNSMVDCIAPATGAREIALAKTFDIDDPVPVTHEHFRQWVMEDEFCAGRPDWEKVGVTFTDHVHDHENMKIRMLNGGHQLIAQISDLLGIETIAESMKHAQIRAMFYQIERAEIAPHVKATSEFTPQAYIELIDQRFSNPAIVDTTRRVAFDGSSRHPGFIIPSIRDGINKGTSVAGLAFISAIWARYCLGMREDGTEIQANDPHWETLKEQARRARQTPLEWLKMRHIYGDLARQARFADSFTNWLNMINTKGVNTALEACISNGDG